VPFACEVSINISGYFFRLHEKLPYNWIGKIHQTFKTLNKYLELYTFKSRLFNQLQNLCPWTISWQPFSCMRFGLGDFGTVIISCTWLTCMIHAVVFNTRWIVLLIRCCYRINIAPLSPQFDVMRHLLWH